MKKLIAGNWKMNGSRDEVNQLAYDLMTGLSAEPSDKFEILLCPPFVYLDRMDKFFKATPVSIGAQDCSPRENGAFTGDVSASMLADMGCSYVILGHSERRTYHHESSEDVRAKAMRALAAGLKAIICIGESEKQRTDGIHMETVADQLEHSLPPGFNSGNTVIAYEPVWAIGTGKTASPQDVEEMHGFIRKKLSEKIKDAGNLRILYGGSMKPDNAAALLATRDVDGGLIGGASLDAASFIAIASAA